MKTIKFLFKLAVIAVVVYFLAKMPFFEKYTNNFKASLFEKVNNVTNEYERVKSKAIETKKKVDETKNAVKNIADTVEKTAETTKDALSAVSKAAETIDKTIEGIGGADKEVPPTP